MSVPACFVGRGAAGRSRCFLGLNVTSGTGEAHAGGWGLHQDLRLCTGTLWPPIHVMALEQKGSWWHFRLLTGGFTRQEVFGTQKSNFVLSPTEMTQLKWMFTIQQRMNGIKSPPCFR